MIWLCLCYNGAIKVVGWDTDRMTREEYKKLVKTYRDRARKKYTDLKNERKTRRGLSLQDRWDLYLADRVATKNWKKRISHVQDPHSKKAQKKGYRYFKKLQHRKIKWGIFISIVLAIVLLFSYWLWAATRPLTEQQQAARQTSLEVAERVMDEGMVLLKNDNDVLPLKNHQINVFGAGASKAVYGGGGAGGIATNSVLSVYEALEQQNIAYNPALYNLYGNFAYSGKASSEDFTRPGKTLFDTLLPSIGGFLATATPEMPVSNIDGAVLDEATKYSDTAIYVVSRVGTETIDLKPEELKFNSDEEQTLRTLNDRFKHVVVLLNTTNAMELGLLEQLENVDSILWVGAPGEVGAVSIAKALKGDVNPSGRLTDTYAYSLDSNPAVRNTGDFQYVHEDGSPSGRYFVNNLEDIYVGYRYYETFVPAEQYESVVQYPFGYGLSYTDFAWQVESNEVNENTISTKVRVTNSGEKVGKDVVQLYYAPPYVAGGVEKSAVVLGGYAKTNALQPGESEVVTVEFATNDMASYDSETEQAWVLDAGNYELRVARNVHDTVETFAYPLAAKKVIKQDTATGTEIQNRFDDADGGLTYLSRENPEATKPVAPSGDALLLPKNLLDFDYKHQASNADEPTTGAKNGIQLAQLKGLAYDDPLWDQFLDQLTAKELVQLAGDGGYWSAEIKRLGVPKTTMYDGPASIRNFLQSWATVAYPVPVNLSATWNTSLSKEVGVAMGDEAKSFNVDAVYAPSLNLHRSPLGGRNFEYYSEDPLITGTIGSAYVEGLQSTDAVAVIKHFAANEQETNRAAYGLYTWSTEQSLRELYLRPFEIAVKQGDAHGVMSAFNRVGPIWAGGSKPLLTDVLRDEWGFEGFVITDAGIAGQGEHFDALQAVEAGNDLMLAFIIQTPGDNVFEKELKNYMKEDRAGTLTALRKAAHNICFYVLQTSKLN